MEDFELRDRPNVSFEKPADDILDYELFFPEAFVFLRKHGMERLSFDELEHRWNTRSHFPEYQKHQRFFLSLPFLRQASEYYHAHTENYTHDIAPYTRFFSQEFLGWLDERGYTLLSFSDLQNRWDMYHIFDTDMSRYKREFEMLYCIDLLQPLQGDANNSLMANLLDNPVWGLTPTQRDAFGQACESIGWQRLFDAFVIFGGTPLHVSDIRDIPALFPFGDQVDRIFHCAHESLRCAIDDKTLPEGDWFGPRIVFAENSTRKHRDTPSSTMKIVVGFVVLQILGILAALDATSRQPRVIYPGVIDDVRTRCAEICAGISGIFD